MNLTSNVKLLLIAKYYGLETQRIKACEEMAELTKELLKWESRSHVAEEIADVQIMLDQIVYLLDCQKEIDEIRQYKLDRQIRRIKEESEVNGY